MDRAVTQSIKRIAELNAHKSGVVANYRFSDISLTLVLAPRIAATDLASIIEHRETGSSYLTPPLFHVVCGPEYSVEEILPPAGEREKRWVIDNQSIYYFWAPDGSGTITAFDRRTNEGLIWYGNAEKIPPWEYARPFLVAIHSITSPTNWSLVHASAVTWGDRGLLFGGPGKSGKTTTALVCADAGWGYIGDDFVLANHHTGAMCSAYRSARIREDMFARLPRAMSAVRFSSHEGGEARAEIDVGRFSNVVTSDKRISAIIIPIREGSKIPALAPIRNSQVLNALAAFTLIALPGNQSTTYNKLASLIGSIPCFKFDPGTDLRLIPESLRPLCE